MPRIVASLEEEAQAWHSELASDLDLLGVLNSHLCQGLEQLLAPSWPPAHLEASRPAKAWDGELASDLDLLGVLDGHLCQNLEQLLALC